MDIYTINKIITKTIEPAVSLLFPKNCLVCGYEITTDNNNAICLSCINNHLPYRDKDGYDFCRHCGNVLESKESLCKCEKNTKYYFNEMKACFYYDDTVRYIIHKMKFEARYKICKDMAAILNFYYSDYIKSHDIIMPVVLNRHRLVERGYNQSKIIAHDISKRTHVCLDTKSVKRTKNTKKLSFAKNLHERLNIIDNAFTLNKRYSSNLEGKSILLIDDIFTTGTTVNAISKIIAENVSVSKINVLCIAKA